MTDGGESEPVPNWRVYKSTVLLLEGVDDSRSLEGHAIVTAHNPEGSRVANELNREQDRRLHAALVAAGCAPLRVHGCSPDLSHREASWAAAMSLADAVALGRRFRQDAIFYVERGRLVLVSCGRDAIRDDLGPLEERVRQLSRS